MKIKVARKGSEKHDKTTTDSTKKQSTTTFYQTPATDNNPRDTKAKEESKTTKKSIKNRFKLPKAPKNTKNIKLPFFKSLSKIPKKILGIIGVIIAIIVIALITYFIFSLFKGQPIDKSYFVTDDTKVSINMNASQNNSDTSGPSKSLVETHIVYEYDGDTVTGLKTYFEYSDAETAKSAYESLKSQPEFEGAEIKDNYIIVTAKPESFQGLTASDVKQQEEAIRQFQEGQKQKQEKKEKEQKPEQKDGE